MTELHRMLIKIEYDGTPFVGWQSQENGDSIQHEIEIAAHKLTTRSTAVQGAGRTDAGVHAIGQAAHLDVPLKYTTRSVMMGLNSYLESKPISIVSATRVANDFNARFDAIERRYLYRMLTRAARPSLDKYRVWHLAKILDIKSMQEAAQHLEGKHDFTSFRATHCQAKSPIRTLQSLEVRAAGDEIHIIAIARSFLHNQIRNITGSLVEVGKGKWNPNRIKEILAAKDRREAGPTAPPDGLYLTDVIYPDSVVNPDLS